MQRPENNKWLDEVLGKVIGSEKSEPNFEKWQAEHPEAVEMLTSRAGRQSMVGTPPLRKGFRIMKSPIMKLGSAAVIIIAVIIGIKSLGGTAAWAAVIEAFNNAGNVHIVKKDVSADGRIIRDIEAWIKNQTCFRVEARDWSIIDDGKNVLTLYKEHKIAHLRESFTPYWDYTPVILKVFRDNEPESNVTVTMLPKESNDEMHVYRIDFRDYWRGKAWVDAASNLPMKIVGYESEGVGLGKEFEMAFAYEPVPNERFKIVIPPYCRELPRIVSRERVEERAGLFGSVVDEQGNPVAGAVVCASYAQYGRTDENGKFSLTVPPSDASNSLSLRDFPMFVWAFEENEPYRVAWTIIRHRRNERRLLAEDDPDYGVLELTERGVELVKLVIRDEDELNENIAGNTGEFFSDLHADLQVRDIVLVMEQGSSITGWVNDSFGEPIANATVGIEELEMQLGSNRIIVSNLLSHDWKGMPFAVTDGQGNYSLNNLPACWAKVRLKAAALGYRSNEQEFESDGNTVTDACTFQLREGTENVEFPSIPGESAFQVRYGF
ncbi:MAG: carboxypeptidase regulatory-like domain-containing protein [Planctomycetota bacterium]|jgi:hypothetical protein